MTTSSSALRRSPAAHERRVLALPLAAIVTVVVAGATVAILSVGAPVSGMSSIAWRMLWLASDR